LAIVYLVVKLRITPPGTRPKAEAPEASIKDVEKFLAGNKEAEELSLADSKQLGLAHTPYWPGVSPCVYYCVALQFADQASD
jgi:translocation protein SEC63